MFTDELCELLCPTYGSDEWLKEIHFSNQLPIISKNDVEMLFDDQHKALEKSDSRQIIFFGAPGTGKSHTVKDYTKALPEGNVFRTTFHPDSDYATFVGCYKPTKVRKAVRDMAGNIALDKNKNEI